MNKFLTLPILAVLIGVVNGIIRFISLIKGYEPETLLKIPNNIFSTIFITVFVISSVFFVVFLLKFKNSDEKSFEISFSPKNTYIKMINIISGFFLIIGGVCGIYFAINEQNISFFSKVPEFSLWILATLSGVAIIFITNILNKNELTSSNANFILIPMFWTILDLVVIFKSNAASPFIDIYSYKLLPAIFLTMSFFSLAEFLYSKPRPKRFVIFSCLAVFLCTLQVTSAVLSSIFAPSMWQLTAKDIARYICISGGAFWAFSLLICFISSCKNFENQK